MLLVDQELSRRLERAEARANASFVEARRRLSPHSDAEWIEVAGAYAMYDNPDSPCTQTFGLGLFDAVTPAHLDELEAFFKGHGAPVFHEVSPLADKALLPLLTGRGYAPVELTSLLFQELRDRETGPLPDGGGISVRVIGVDEAGTWARTAADGWSETPEAAAIILDLAQMVAAREDEVSFLAEFQGRPIATGALNIQGDVAVLAGASTVPEYRRLGAQRVLLEARLRHAAKIGCELAMMGAEPGSASQRNSERQGFRIAYTRIKWGLTER